MWRAPAVFFLHMQGALSTLQAVQFFPGDAKFRERNSRNTDEMVNALGENCSVHVSMSVFPIVSFTKYRTGVLSLTVQTPFWVAADVHIQFWCKMHQNFYNVRMSTYLALLTQQLKLQKRCPQRNGRQKTPTLPCVATFYNCNKNPSILLFCYVTVIFIKESCLHHTNSTNKQPGHKERWNTGIRPCR